MTLSLAEKKKKGKEERESHDAGSHLISSSTNGAENPVSPESCGNGMQCSLCTVGQCPACKFDCPLYPDCLLERMSQEAAAAAVEFRGRNRDTDGTGPHCCPCWYDAVGPLGQIELGHKRLARVAWVLRDWQLPKRQRCRLGAALWPESLMC